MKKWLFNPFVYIAGARSLVIGWVIMLITACICMYSHTHFDGVLDAHNGRVTLASMYFIEPFTDWICLVLALYLGGIIFSKSTIRFIDVAGTLALARWPLLFYSIIGFGLNPRGINEHSDINALVNSVTGTMILLAIIGGGFVIWMVVLLYNAFSVSCNIKGGKAAGVFIGGLAVAEAITKIIFHLLYKHMI